MSMLSRYKKEGGFEQLLMLIEQCHKKKQDQLISLVENEDLVWAERLRSKMLTRERVVAFPAHGLAEIFTRIPEKVLVFALHGLEPQDHEKILATFTHFKQKAVLELLEGEKPKPEQIEAAFLVVFKIIRDLDKQHVISIEKLAPELSLREKKAA
jgi:flagellar motor switch protein FliG